VSNRLVSRRPPLRTALLVGACAPLLAGLGGCATGFGSPTRHAVANLQAASTQIGSTLAIRGAIIALPSGVTSAKGGLAYLQFSAINMANAADPLINVTVAPVPASASSSASVAASAELLQAAGNTTIPAATAGAPGTARVNILLRNLTVPLTQGDTVVVGLAFKNGGSITGLLVPVQSAASVGSSFLPSAPPPAPSSAAPSSAAPSSAPASSAPAVSSPAVGSSAPASSAPASASASPTAAASS
jgi:hypothetical protein